MILQYICKKKETLQIINITFKTYYISEIYPEATIITVKSLRYLLNAMSFPYN